MFLIILPLAVYQFIASEKVYNIILKYVTYSAQQGFDQTFSFLSYRVEKIAEATDVVAPNPTLTSLLEDKRNLEDINQELENYYDLKQLLKSMQDRLDISRIWLYVPNTLIFSNDSENFLPISYTEKNPCIARLNTERTKYVWCTSAELGDGAGSGDHLSVVRPILNLNNYLEPIGYLRVDVKKEDLLGLLSKANVVKKSSTYLLGDRGEVVLSSDPNGPATLDLPADVSAVPGMGTNYRGDYVLQRPIPSSKWRMVTMIPLDEVAQQSRQMRNDLLVLLFAVTAIAYLLAYLFSFSVTRRITQLTYRLKEVQQGNFIALAQSQGKDEIGELIRTYNFMVEKIGTMNKEQYKLGQEVKSAELKALQSQINPHFLYNTLDMINWMADKGMNAEIKNVVKALSRFYKVSLSNGKDVITLQEEIKHVTFYVQIQNIRFENQIEFEVHVDDSLMDLPIPKITLQPLVENAIFHGLQGRKSREGKVVISAARGEDGVVEITVADDGVGMSEELLSRLNAGMQATSRSGSGYGIANVANRIRTYFGESYGVSFQSQPGVGTLATIRIPDQPAED
jgi:two-component system sensor histidine kinase YesM